jgi:predicted phage terminase large subunit-like protein
LLELQAIANEDTEDEEPLWPGWFSLEALHEKREKLPEREWRSLYQQRPTSEGGDYCKREWFSDRYTEAPERMRIYMASDMAVTKAVSGEEGRGPDYTEHGVFGIGTDDHVYVLDWWYGRTTPDAWIDAWIALVLKWRPDDWFSEAGVIRRAVEGFIAKRMQEKKAYVNIEWMASIADKEARGQAFRGRASMRTWHFPAGAPWADRVIDQCVAFPGGEFDDAFDVCSLFGRAVNEVLAARPKPKDKPRRDPWADDRVANDWKTA